MSAHNPPPPPRPGPSTRPVAEALKAHGTLTQLLERLRESQARLDAVRAAIPAPLRAHVRAGVLDETGWNLLVPNGAVAAKLRQSLPSIELALAEQGWKATAVRVKVQAESP